MDIKNDFKEIINTMKEKGYFKIENTSNAMRFDNTWGTFQQITIEQFISDLGKNRINQDTAINYGYYILKELPIFPADKYKNYNTFIMLSKERKKDEVINAFLDTQYKQNDSKKHQIIEVNTIHDQLQLLINSDVFTDNKNLYHYNADEKVFIQVNENNIADIIGCTDKDFAINVLQNGLKYYSQLIYLYDTLAYFDKAYNNEIILKNCKNDYEEICSLISQFQH